MNKDVILAWEQRCMNERYREDKAGTGLRELNGQYRHMGWGAERLWSMVLGRV